MKLNRKIVGILKFVFRVADVSGTSDLDLIEFQSLLNVMGIKVSDKGSELLFRAILSSHHQKQYMGFYEFKQAFFVSNLLDFIQTPNDLNPARILRRHIRKYYENVAQEHKRNRRKLAEIAWKLFRNELDTMSVAEFKEGLRYLGVCFVFHFI